MSARTRLRNSVNRIAASLIRNTAGMLPPSNRARRSAHVLLYHSIGEPVDVVDGYSLRVSERAFRSQMEFLSQNARVLSLPDMLACAGDGRQFGETTVALTFDDGFLDNLTHALPILQEFGFPATVFVVTDFLEGKSSAGLKTLNREGLVSLHRGGVEIGSHLQAHRPIVTFSRDDAVEQLARSRAILEDALSAPVRFLSFPFGGAKDAPPVYRRLAEETGYEAAFSALYGGVHPADFERYFLPRVPVDYQDTPANFARKIRGRLDRLRHLQQIRDALLYDPQTYHQATGGSNRSDGGTQAREASSSSP